MVCHCLLCFFLSITHADMVALGRVSGRSDRDAVTGGGSARPSRSTSESGRWARSVCTLARSVAGEVAGGVARRVRAHRHTPQPRWCDSDPPRAHCPLFCQWVDPPRPRLSSQQLQRSAAPRPTRQWCARYRRWHLSEAGKARFWDRRMLPSLERLLSGSAASPAPHQQSSQHSPPLRPSSPPHGTFTLLPSFPAWARQACTRTLAHLRRCHSTCAFCQCASRSRRRKQLLTLLHTSCSHCHHDSCSRCSRHALILC
jgi:hypothetical protein